VSTVERTLVVSTEIAPQAMQEQEQVTHVALAQLAGWAVQMTRTLMATSQR
jgi:hypothetical protein